MEPPLCKTCKHEDPLTCVVCSAYVMSLFIGDASLKLGATTLPLPIACGYFNDLINVTTYQRHLIATLEKHYPELYAKFAEKFSVNIKALRDAQVYPNPAPEMRPV